MKGILYLLLTIFKNRILSLHKKPAVLVLGIVCVLSIILVIGISIAMPEAERTHHAVGDIRILYAIVAGVGLLTGYSFLNMGLSTGGTLFNMADVSLLFVSPISSTKILLYGLIKQLGTTALTSIFIIFQIPNIKNNFNISGMGIAAVFLLYATFLFFGQLMSIAVYVFTNGNSTRKGIVKYGFYAICGTVALYIFWQYRISGNLLESGLGLMDNRLFQLIPVAGWGTMFVQAVVEKDILFACIGYGLFILGSILVILLITAGDADYYEDVLVSTETTYAKLQAAKEGKMNIRSSKKVKIKEKESGIRHGMGPNVIFFKHLLESRRRNRFGYLGMDTLLSLIGTIVFCHYVPHEWSGYVVLAVLVYLQFFMTVIGNLSLELNKPFIYLMPGKSVHKLIAASLSNAIKPLLDGTLIFTAVAVMLRTPIIENILLMAAYVSSSLIFIGFTILAQRFLGGQLNKFLASMFGIGLFAIIIAPGIIMGVIVMNLLPTTFAYVGLIPYIFWALIVVSFVFLLCGDFFDQSEIKQRNV